MHLPLGCCCRVHLYHYNFLYHTSYRTSLCTVLLQPVSLVSMVSFDFTSPAMTALGEVFGAISYSLVQDSSGRAGQPRGASSFQPWLTRPKHPERETTVVPGYGRWRYVDICSLRSVRHCSKDKSRHNRWRWRFRKCDIQISLQIAPPSALRLWDTRHAGTWRGRIQHQCSISAGRCVSGYAVNSRGDMPGV